MYIREDILSMLRASGDDPVFRFLIMKEGEHCIILDPSSGTLSLNREPLVVLFNNELHSGIVRASPCKSDRKPYHRPWHSLRESKDLFWSQAVILYV